MQARASSPQKTAPAPKSAATPQKSAAAPKSRLGGTPAAFTVRAQGGGGAASFDIVTHCRQIGLGGVQTSITAIELEMAEKLGKKAKANGLDLILDAPALPVEEGQLYRFDFALKACLAAGVKCLRIAPTERRWEQYENAQAFRRDFDRFKSNVSLAVPVFEKNKIRMAVENHGGWRSAEMADWLNRLSCDYIGACFDFSDSMGLCEDPMDSLRTLSPYIFMCHIKDVAVSASDDGFLLAEVALGDGILDLKEMVRLLRAKDANMPFYLDVATRDPVKVPVTSDRYLATFTDNYSPLPGKDLANILDIVRKNPPKQPLPKIAGLAQAEALKLEDESNRRSIEYARKVLGL
jgi:3-oxoisoapionate decarboxylase